MGRAVCHLVICAMQGLVAWLYCGGILGPRRPVRTAALLYTGGYLLLWALRLLGLGAWGYLVLFGLVSGLLLVSCFHCGAAAAALHAGLLCVALALGDGLAALLLVPFQGYFAAWPDGLLPLTARAVLGMPLYFWAAAVAGSFFRPDPVEDSPETLPLLSLLPLATEVACIAFIYVGCALPPQPAAEWLMVVSMLALLLVDLLVLLTYSNVRKIYRQDALRQLAAQKNEDDLRFYTALQQQHQSQRILIHDIRRHTQTLQALLAAGDTAQASAYLGILNELPGMQNHKVFCKNKTLNIILTQHHSRCRAAGVQLHQDIRESCIDGMDAVSITALFGNLLTNACEAAEASEEKYIEFCIAPQQTGGALITVQNSCDKPPQTDANGLFLTRKRDKTAHGVGLSSMAQVVARYGGTLKMYYDADEKAVHTVIGIKK